MNACVGFWPYHKVLEACQPWGTKHASLSTTHRAWSRVLTASCAQPELLSCARRHLLALASPFPAGELISHTFRSICSCAAKPCSTAKQLPGNPCALNNHATLQPCGKLIRTLPSLCLCRMPSGKTLTHKVEVACRGADAKALGKHRLEAELGLNVTFQSYQEAPGKQKLWLEDPPSSG